MTTGVSVGPEGEPDTEEDEMREKSTHVHEQVVKQLEGQVQKQEQVHIEEIDSIVQTQSEIETHANAHIHMHRLLQEKVSRLHQDNQRLVHRIYQVKRLTRRYKKEIDFLMARLDKHGDPFRTIRNQQDIKPTAAFLNATITGKSSTTLVPTDKYNSGKKSSAKRKSNRSNKDSIHNSEYQFYREQGPLVIAEGTSDEILMRVNPRQSSSRWISLPIEDKRERVAMTERARQYAEAMSTFMD